MRWLDRTLINFHKTGMFFRICGYGLTIYRDEGWPPLYSERHGYNKTWRFWGLVIKTLKPL